MPFQQVRIFGQIRGILVVKTDHLCVFFQKIETDVSVALKEAHFAHLFHRDATGSQVGNTTIVKLDARVRNIWRFADHRNPVGAYFGRPGVNHTQNNVQVVDHQVEHHRYVRSARIECGQAVRFNEHGVEVGVFQRQQGGVEALHVANLYLYSIFFAQSNQFFGLRDGMGKRFFDKHVLTRLDDLYGQGEMGGRGRDNIYHIHSLDKGFDRLKGSELELFGYGFRH